MKVTIVMPAYNEEKYISDAIISVLQQTWKGEKEIIVVDDCSTDSTKDIVAVFDGVKYVKTESNSGISAARQLGVKSASDDSDYLTFLSGDDMYEKDFLEVMVKGAGDNKGDIMYCGYHACNPNMNVLFPFMPPKFDSVADFGIACWVNAMKCNMFVNWDCLMFPMKIAKENPYWEEIRYGEDLEMVLRLAVVNKQRFTLVDKLLVKYRMHPENVTSKKVMEIPQNDRKIMERIVAMLNEKGSGSQLV